MFHVEHRGKAMKIWPFTELLLATRELYGEKPTKIDEGSTISEGPIPTHTHREKRGAMVYRMGEQPTGNQRPDGTHTERREEVNDRGGLSRQNWFEKRRQ